ncbi:phage integrase SAM-like domain-containing protein [Reyranella aquatilis]|uniref:Phage integrase SAM-like domain-containing protein n=1 Tax=Reyranella aquatilis TaxID=2035356 RepID=A0ABS8KV35_9HYPH|nr:site-specific integrase [Reyranella aquatilis]MCC8429899.1 phage integrase SAM-like domain-containing protein [Reyranella aquatilis]
MSSESIELFGGDLRLYKRENSSLWQCSASLKGTNHRKSTKEDNLARAREIAEDWYLELRGKSRAGLLKGRETTFNEAANRFVEEYEIITEGERSEKYVQSHSDRLRVHLRPFFGTKPLTDINPALVQEYRMHRAKTSRTGKPPSRSAMHHEIVTLRQVLKTAIRQGWLQHLPDMSLPYRKSGKVEHRGWFSPGELARLIEASRKRVSDGVGGRPLRWKWEYEQFDDYLVFMSNTGLRPDEAARLEFRDVTIVKDWDTQETILEIEVRGKRGTGYCKSTAEAVEAFRRLSARMREGKEAGPTDLLFPGGTPRELMNNILGELKLKFDREGRRRSSYSLRHTYICTRLMNGADIYQIAKNCRTSVEMIEKYYAAHLKTTLDASAINVRKPRRPEAGRYDIPVAA